MNPEINNDVSINGKPNKRTKFSKREGIDGWIFVLPFVISILVFFIGPLLVAFLISFKEYSFLDSTSVWGAKFVGLQNYIDAFTNDTFIKALSNSIKYSLVVVPTQLVLALILALIVDSKIKGKTFFRMAYYIPTITSTVAVSVMFLFLFKVDGLFNKILSVFGIAGKNWFVDINFALPAVMLMAIWSSVGLYMVIFLAGLQDVPVSLYEASSIDGASSIQQLFKITIPLIKPTIFFNLIVSMIGTLQMFDQSYVVSGGNGGPLDSTMTVVLHIYNTGFKEFKMGYACAVAFILFGIIMLLTLIQKKLFGEETEM